MGSGKWEMSATWAPCGKCHPLSLEHRKLQGPKMPAGNSSEQHAADGKRRLSSALCFHSQVNRMHLFSLPTQLGNRKREIGSRPLSLRGGEGEAREAGKVHGRPGRPPSTEMGLAFRTDRPRPEDPGRSGRSELSGSGDCPATCER